MEVPFALRGEVVRSSRICMFQFQDVSIQLSTHGEKAQVQDQAWFADVPAFLEGLVGDWQSDEELLSARGVDALPRGMLGRAVAEAARNVHQALRVTDPSSLPTIADSYRGAVVDLMMEHVPDDVPVLVKVGDVARFRLVGDTTLEQVGADDAALLFESVRGLEVPIHAGAVGVGGARCEDFTDGVADAIALVGGGAATTAYGLKVLHTQMSAASQGFDGTDVDQIWFLLSRGVKTVSMLQAGGLVRAGALSLRGRGRLVGPLSGDHMLRFGVSDWR